MFFFFFKTWCELGLGSCVCVCGGVPCDVSKRAKYEACRRKTDRGP